MAWLVPYSILKNFAPLCERMGDNELAKRYLDTADRIVENMRKMPGMESGTEEHILTTGAFGFHTEQ